MEIAACKAKGDRLESSNREIENQRENMRHRDESQVSNNELNGKKTK